MNTPVMTLRELMQQLQGCGPDEDVWHYLSRRGALRPGMAPAHRSNGDPQVPPKIHALTSRELQVMQELVKGQLYKEIGDSLGITLDTVRTHVISIYRKLDVHSRTEAVVQYLSYRHKFGT